MQPEIQQLMLSKLESLTLEINSLRELIKQGEPVFVARGSKKASPKATDIRKNNSKKSYMDYFEQLDNKKK